MRKEQLKHIFEAWDDEKGIIVDNSDFYLSWYNFKANQIANQFGDEYRIRIVHGCRIDLESLSQNQSVVTGDGKTYHFLLTEIEN